MIKLVKVCYFKQFEEETFDLCENIILAGPNNSGKTTLLQAIAVWNLAMQKWLTKRSASKRKLSTGVVITRKDFTAIPLREMNLLWTNTSTALKKDELKPEQKLGTPRVMTITLKGVTKDNGWEMTFEFRYRGEEMISVRPSPEHIDNIPRLAMDLNVVHVPPFSGIGVEETEYKREYQDLLIGQSKPGDIVRNLLVEVYKQNKSGWDDLVKQIEELFGYQLLPPEYEGKPFILCEYLPGIPKGKGLGGLSRLDIANAGSGFHQVLMLLAFFYARSASILLLDEPDAHLHVVLQKQIYQKLQAIADKRDCQLIIATHSEVLIDATSPDRILSFYDKPHLLNCDVERDQVREALKRVTAMDILQAEKTAGVLYVESEQDFNLLCSWSFVLKHPLYKWFTNSPMWQDNRGRNPREARAHFFALQAIQPQIKGYLLLDGDNRKLPDHELAGEGFIIGRWTRYESESYLIHPEALLRFVHSKLIPIFADLPEKYLQDKLTGEVLRNPLGKHVYLNEIPVSKTILPDFFKTAQLPLSKDEYYRIAEQMRPDEIVPEVQQKLDDIAQMLGIALNATHLNL
ncbi:MAG: AAA family ATPase [bacterium]